MPYRDPQALSHFEELDRQSKAHHAAMHQQINKLGGGNYYMPREQAPKDEIVFIGAEPIDPRIEA